MDPTAQFLQGLQERSFRLASDATRGAYPAANRLSGPQLAAYLERRKYLVIATTRADGRPHAALSSFVIARDGFWMPTETGTARARNLEANPHASLVVTEGEGDVHIAVVTEGPVELISGAGGTEAEARWRSKFGTAPTWADSWIKLRPAKLFSYAADPSALGGGLKIFRCRHCGDTFPAHERAAVACPSCGSSVVDLAGEASL